MKVFIIFVAADFEVTKLHSLVKEKMGGGKKKLGSISSGVSGVHLRI